ncbi:MAG: NAD(P)/FAD-dependent oxidoreductase [Actinobacteria bacterium]|nr:NAD(P)/FAD-dependent oxidoreductase [Actinomycetota bacterium]
MADHDVIIVGARAAGASTALLLARAGWRVLVVDRARRGSDTLSTHALMRPGVLQLQRWGLLDAIIAAGTPGQDRVVFHYGDDRVDLELSSRLYAPRRTVLDPVLVAAAEDSGAVVRFGVDVRGLLRDPDGRVTGIRVRDRHGRTIELRSRMTVGADGRRSLVARDVDAEVTRRGANAAAAMYGYWTGVETAGYEWGFRPGRSAGLIPTGDARVCVYAGMPPQRFAHEVRYDPEGGLHRVLAETTPSVAERVAAGQRVEPVRGFPGMPGWLRRPWGPGWALVGDAGYFKDPITAHGITDALRDAELLARALDRLLRGDVEPADALADYERRRDALSIPLLEITDAVASFAWTLPEVQRLHLKMSDAMQQEVDALTELDPLVARPVAA